jgi:hypothetical protein
MGKTMTVKTVMEDSDGQLFLQFDLSELNQMGWDVGDIIIWEECENGWTATKKD